MSNCKMLLRGSALSTILAAALSWSTVAAAQAANAGAADAAQPNDGEIVVTALKRDTTLQKTPISISAVTGDTLSKSGVQNISNLAGAVPSLTFVDAGPSFRRVVIRGIQAAGEPTVGVYYDEAPVTGVIGTANDAGGTTPELRLFDVQRAEVLRGPQGTLYGAGSMGGTLRIIYNKPTFETEGLADASISDTQDGGFNYELNGMVNLPVITDKIAVRAVGFYQHNDGYIDNVTLGVKGINGLKSYGGRVMARVTPTERFTLDLAAYINRTYTDTPTWIKESGRYNADYFTRLPVRDRLNLYSATANWDLDSVKLTGVVSYFVRHIKSADDQSELIQSRRTAASCASLYNSGAACGPTTLSSFYGLIDSQADSVVSPDQDVHALTTELRLSSAGTGPFNWTVGGFYSHRHEFVHNAANNVDSNGDPIASQLVFYRNIYDTLNQAAAFADLSWDITSKLNITGGARYFHYSRSVAGETPMADVLLGARLVPLTRASSKENGTVVKVNASYKFTPNIMAYFEAAQGFRPGGANQVIGLPEALTPYQSDKLWDYEAGIKTSFFQHKLTLNLDVFRIDWSNLQVTGRPAATMGTFTFITNAGDARVQGVELEGGIRPLRGLTLSGSFSYMTPELTQDQTNATILAAGLKGDRIPYVPKMTMGGSAEYRFPLNRSLNAYLRGDYNHLSDSYSDFRPNATYTRRIPAYDMVNARVGIETADGKRGVYLYVNNLFNALGITREFSGAFWVGRTLTNSATPRTVGLNLRTAF
ncbi:TonB-dependent receptor [Sphingomonas nostoxanthinifaciens]|uniref:TonB-dependent receptor n=1 Tax=Sphingomonas nostoxanthinifaciens TaxID=2872652 RepID=UPI001CC21B33|nr:TonB-dependent receptor [Sphingomonas nostoxanthinifaciens]UAK25809.1 TonB-dependent receptor [Sphingomonas nostoxanthinifaciens]